MAYELNSSAASDEISMPSGLLELNGQQFNDFTFTPLDNFGIGSYPLIDAGWISGSLGSSTMGTIDGMPATLAVEGNDLVLVVVPKPSTLMLLAAALGSAAVLCRRNGRGIAPRAIWAAPRSLLPKAAIPP